MSLQNSNVYRPSDDTDRNTVSNWINTAALSTNPTERIELLHKVQEFLIHKSNNLLLELLDDILAFTNDRTGDVKKVVVGFIEEACKLKEEIIPKVVINLHMLLCDESVQVQKRVIQASSSIYRKMMYWLSKASVIKEELEQAWSGLNRIKIEIVNMIDSDNDGIRTHSIKFLEVVVLLQTYSDPNAPRKDNEFSLDNIPLTLKIARRRKLEEEANHIFSLLLKFHGSPHISSVNLMACMGSLCNIAKSRPQFMSQVVTALESLPSNFPPTLSQSQVSSVKKHLKLQLFNILKHPSSVEHRSSITTLLLSLGCTNQEITKVVPRLAEDKKRNQKRTVESTMQPVFKKARLIQEIEVKTEESEKSKQTPVEINRQFIAEHLNMNSVVQLIFMAMKNVPNVMPPRFINDYLKAFRSGNPITLNDIGKILAEQFTEAGVGPGSKKVNDQQTPSLTSELETVLLKDNDNIDIKTEKIHKEVKISRAPKPRVKTLKLYEITRPLNNKVREQMLISSVTRILQSEKTAIKIGIGHVRCKIITTLAATFSPPVREAVLQFLISDIRSHLDLALAWLYEEFSLMQGFNRMPSVLKREEKPDESYNSLFCALISNLQTSELKERDTLLSRLFLEAPMITEEAFEILLQICMQKEQCIPALNLVHDLVVRRPTRGIIYLNALLTFCISDDSVIRETATEKIISLYERLEWQMYIEKCATEYLEMLQLPEPREDLFGGITGRIDKVASWNDDLSRICLSLYLSLIPYNEILIHELAKVYTQTSPDIKRTILRLLEQPVRGMGMDSPELLMLVEKCPKGSETLVTRIIHILSDRGPPSPMLVAKVRELYQSRVSDVRFLIPVLNGLTKKEITSALPKLIKLNPIVVKEVFNRLLGMHGDSPISPSELLITLHLIDPSKAELKAVMKATSLCFAEKQIYTQEVLAVVIQQLMDNNPLPTLLMRTVIQSLSLYPRLTGFVMNILQRLILKQVWRQKIVWEGFVKCCQRTKPQSFQVLLQLPSPQLTEALTMCPDLKQPLLDHIQALTETQKAHVSSSTMDVLLDHKEMPSSIVSNDTFPDVQPAEIKEKLLNNDEPLPPGMD